MKIIQENTQEVIMSAVDKLVELVKPTFGPSENKVIIGRGFGASALDDGVQIAKDLELEDEAENYVLKLIREVAVKTNDRVGDGTTSSLIMLQAILKEAQNSKLTSQEIVLDLKKGLVEAVEHIKTKSKGVNNKEDLVKVAKVSYNNNEIAELLADLIYKVGEGGLIDVQSSQGASIESEIVGGFKIDGGYVSPYLANEGEKCILEDVPVLATDKSFFNNLDIVPVMEAVLKTGKSSLVVFCKDFSGEALTTAVLNKMKGSFRLLAVKTQENDIKDIAMLTGARHVLLETKIDVSDLGLAGKVVSTVDSTKIVDGSGDPTQIAEFVAGLSKDEENISRVANLTSSVAVVRVGAKTESEAKSLRFKVEDAGNAIRVAYRGGVVSGAGRTLESIKTSSDILNKALKYPKEQLTKNMGGFDVSDDVVDPTEVLVAGVESAVSIACLLISTTGIIYDTKTTK